MTDTLFPVFLLGNAIMKDQYFPGGAGEDQSETPVEMSGIGPEQGSARALLDAIKQVAAAGRGGDELLAYLSPESVQALMSMGGAGTVNPVTSLPEFKSGGQGTNYGGGLATAPAPAPAPAPATVVLPRPSDQLRRLIEAQPAIDAWRESLGSFDEFGRLEGINPVVPASSMGSQGISVRPVAAPVFGQSAGVAPGAFVSRGINIRPIDMPSLPSLGQMASQPSLQNGISTPYFAPYVPRSMGPATMEAIQMAPMGFAEGGEADVEAMRALVDAAGGEEEEDDSPINTDPVGSAQRMLDEYTAREAPSTTQISGMRRRPSGGGAPRPKEMGSEYESLTTARAPEPKGAKSAQAELRALARGYELKKIAAENEARALMRNTLGAPTLRKPGLTKESLSVRRFEKGGEVEKEEPSISGLLRRLGLAVARGVPQAATGIVDLAALPLTATGIRKAEDVVGTTDYLTKRGLLPPPQEGLASESAELLSGMVSPGGAAKAAMLGVLGPKGIIAAARRSQLLKGKGMTVPPEELSAQQMLEQLQEQGVDTSRTWLRGKKPSDSDKFVPQLNYDVLAYEYERQRRPNAIEAALRDAISSQAIEGRTLSRQPYDRNVTKFNTRGGVWLTESPDLAQSYSGDMGYIIPVYAPKPDVVLDAKGRQWDDYYKNDKDWDEVFNDPRARLIEVRNIVDAGKNWPNMVSSDATDEDILAKFKATNLFAKKPFYDRTIVNKVTGEPYEFKHGGAVKHRA